MPDRVAGGQIVKENLEALGLEVEHVTHSPPLHFAKLANPSEPFDIADVGFGWDDPHYALNVPSSTAHAPDRAGRLRR